MNNLQILLIILALGAQLFACTPGNQKSEPLAANHQEGKNYIEIEAEDIEIRPPFMVDVDKSVSGGKYVWVPNYSSTITFNVASEGTYKIWGRVFCTYGGSDSFSMRVDDGEPFNWNNVQHSDTWIWDEVNSKDGPITFELSPGQHTLSLRSREAHSKLDGILVTNDMDFTPEGEPEEIRQLNGNKEIVWVEAESGEIKPPYYVLDHHHASGKKFVAVDEERTRVKLDIPEVGKYHIFMKVYAEAGNENSLRLKVGDEQPRKNWHAIPHEQLGGWTWQAVNFEEEDLSPESFEFQAGENSLWINYREEGLKIDKIIITNDLDFKPAETEADEEKNI